jgi:hypothetical protein
MEQSHLSGFCFSSPVLVCNLKPFWKPFVTS